MSDTLQVQVHERIETADGLAGGDGITRYRAADGSLYSVYPPTAYLTTGPWIYLVPPFKPQNILMLGYAGGTVAGLIRLLYGDVPIVGVDLTLIDNRYGAELIGMDARHFVHHVNESFECVIIDLFNGELSSECVTDYDFVSHIARITKRFLIVQTDQSANIGIYEQFFERVRLTNNGNLVGYFKKKDDPRNYNPQ